MTTISPRHAKGFSLIELMIVVAIVGILSAIAYPSYTKHVQKAKRSDAHTALNEVYQRQESYFLRNYSYASGLGGAAGQLNYGTASPEGEYTLSITPTPTGCGGTNASACTGYTATATASGSTQLGDTDCRTLNITNRGTKSSANTSSTDTSTICW